MIRVFVGTDPKQHVAERALEASIRKNTSDPVEITFMRQGDPGWDWGGLDAGWATPFSLFRWHLPARVYGRAIYMDVDMLALGDLRELWEWDLKGQWCAVSLPKPDVIVWDCASVPRDLRIKDVHEQHRCNSVKLPRNWNHRDQLKPNTKLLHFTKLRTQPWKPYPDRYDYEQPHEDPAACELFWEYANAHQAEARS